MDKKSFDNITSLAKACKDEGYRCSECILIAVGPQYIKEVEPVMVRMSTSFAGGVGGTGEELCGALAGGIMLIGALYGRSDAQTNDDYCMELVKEFHTVFKEEFGHIQCQQLKDNWVGKPGQEDCALLTKETAGVLINILEKADSPQNTA